MINCATIKETERNNIGGPSGIGGLPPISTWITAHIVSIPLDFIQTLGL